MEKQALALHLPKFRANLLAGSVPAARPARAAKGPAGKAAAGAKQQLHPRRRLPGEEETARMVAAFKARQTLPVRPGLSADPAQVTHGAPARSAE